MKAVEARGQESHEITSEVVNDLVDLIGEAGLEMDRGRQLIMSVVEEKPGVIDPVLAYQSLGGDFTRDKARFILKLTQDN